MNMKFTGKKNSAYLLELFKYYALSHPNYCYPFGKHSMCFIMTRTYTVSLLSFLGSLSCSSLLVPL